MSGKIFDTHAHYYDEKFDGIRESLISELEVSCIAGVINCGVDIPSSESCIAMAKNHKNFYAAAGYHPESVDENAVFDKEKLIGLLKNDKVVAIGEIGLDYYWDTSFKQKQLEFFEQQLILANELDMPVIVHDREAHADTLNLILKYKPKGVMHCFSGSIETAHEIIKAGMYIGIGGVLTFKNSKKIREIAKELPIDRILLETDAPYMSPEPHRGKINRSDYIIYVAQKLAEIREVTLDEILTATENNARTLFSI